MAEKTSNQHSDKHGKQQGLWDRLLEYRRFIELTRSLTLALLVARERALRDVDRVEVCSSLESGY